MSVWLNPFAVHREISQHCLLIGYTPVQSKKLEMSKNKVTRKKRNGLLDRYTLILLCSNFPPKTACPDSSIKDGIFSFSRSA